MHVESAIAQYFPLACVVVVWRGGASLNVVLIRGPSQKLPSGLYEASSLAEIVEVEIEVVSTELKSHCHLYGARGQRQAYLLPMPR
ncbi:hypothetical protein TNCV_1284641 [Trichonephila clavipes]|uniref:Uncharacterized protein n=1 Tax=Trichonephila clavipes TaxID=2585209 RepID=A0A8X6VPL5_TRICX|nr:hypothetical protein TNCV_1284641 [Trichonephila clavipes]